MYAPIVLGQVDAPIIEKPRLFSHWKPSLAQVASNFNVHSPATLRVRASLNADEFSSHAVIGPTSGGPECKHSGGSETSSLTTHGFVSGSHKPLSLGMLSWCQWAMTLASLSFPFHLKFFACFVFYVSLQFGYSGNSECGFMRQRL